MNNNITYKDENIKIETVEKIFDVRLFEEILINGEIVREQCINDIFNFSRIADLETQRIKRVIDEKQYIYNEIEKELKFYKEFIKKYNAEKEFEKFKTGQNLKVC